jgi:outer membrane lipoprotein SlyB
MRLFATLIGLTPVLLTLAGCGPSYSPDTYANDAVQKANKVDEGVIAGIRPVQISASGTVGGVAGAAAGGVAGSQVGTGTTSTFAAIGGSIIGGVAGVTAEHIVGDTNGFEYMVRKANGDLLSVVQKEDKPLRLGQKVLVISGAQARVVPDYTVPFDAPAKPPAKPAAAEVAPASATPAAAPTSPVPGTTVVPPQLPAAFGASAPSAGAAIPLIVPSTPPPASTEPKP